MSAAEVVLGAWEERLDTCTSVQGHTSPPTHGGEEGTGALSLDHHLPLLHSMTLLTVYVARLSW